MKIISSVSEMSRISRALMGKNLTRGFVPTMGYLHDGHLALMKEAGQRADRVIASIFVNPSQFGPGEDLDQYPRDLERDAALAEEAGVDLLFTPDADALYPEGYQTWIRVEQLSTGLCGASRPDHFRGVATVVAKLFNIVMPDIAVFGMKDFQQLQVIRQMARDLNMQVKIVGHPIVREADGLAMSSRNKYLTEEERKRALCLRKALDLAVTLAKAGEKSTRALKKAMKEHIESYSGTRIDYIFTGRPDSLEETEEIGADGRLLLALAVYVGATRLIDNEVITI
jgi:pantoate--beta-alanine ligase